MSSSTCINTQYSHILSLGCRRSPPSVKEIGQWKLQTQMSLTHRMKKLGAWQGTFHLVLAGITMGSCSRWPELLQLFLCLRGKQNLVQMQCPLLAMQHPSLFGWDPSWATQHPGRYPWCGLSSPHGGPSFFTPVLSCAPGGFPIWAGDSLLPYYWHNSCLMLWPCPLPGWRLWKEGRRCLHC